MEKGSGRRSCGGGHYHFWLKNIILGLCLPIDLVRIRVRVKQQLPDSAGGAV